MEIIRFETCYWQSNMYLIIGNGHCIIIDPCEITQAKDILYENKLILDYAFLTHEHCDHLTGVDWARSIGAKIICSHTCAHKIKNPRLNAARYYNDSSQVQKKLKGTDVPISENFVCCADIYFESTLVLEWDKHMIELVETPGHSSGSICVLFDENILFSGDSLLENEPTNTRFPSGSRRYFEEITLPWIKTINENATVYPGHFNEFTLGDRLKKKFLSEVAI